MVSRVYVARIIQKRISWWLSEFQWWSGLRNQAHLWFKNCYINKWFQALSDLFSMYYSLFSMYYSIVRIFEDNSLYFIFWWISLLSWNKILEILLQYTMHWYSRVDSPNIIHEICHWVVTLKAFKLEYFPVFGTHSYT